jgi:phage-related protein
VNERLTAFVGAKISEFRKKMAIVNKTVRETATKVTKPVGANIREFQRKAAQVKKDIAKIPKKVVVTFTERSEKFQKTMNKIANFMQSFDTIARNTAGGLALMASPALVPVIAGLIGAIGALGPMIGVMGASTFALASAFGLAGIAAVAFGAAAIPSITKLFEENAKLTAQQRAARAEYDKFKSTWQGITKELEKPVLEAFGKSMQFATRVLELSRPLFQSVGTSVNRLLDSLNKSMSSPPVLFFFEYMNKTAGPMLETIGKSFGNFLQGFMNLMVAFGPLSASTAQGFLNMSKGFADWTAGLSGSEKFQAFIRYVNENMPKIRSIFRDAIAGIAYFFTAFGPLSSDMMTGLQGVMSRFKEWAANLQSNQAFQNFLGYIRDNAPKVIQLIGNLADFIVNMSVALAPIGSKILGIVNASLAWINSMMTTNPIIGQIIAGLIVFAGMLIFLVPNIVAFATLFSGAGTAIASAAKFAWSAFLPFKNNLIIGLKLMGTNVGTFVTRMGTATVKVLANFAKMTAQGAVWVAKFVAQIAVKIAQWALLGAKALLHAARVAAAWFIALGPIGWVIATIIGLVVLIIANWDTVKAWTIKIWSAVSEWISTKAREIANKVREKFTDVVNSVREKMNAAKAKVEEIGNKIKSFFDGIDLYESGKAIIQSAIDGLSAMKGKILKKVDNIVGAVRDFWPFSPAKTGPLSDIHKMDFGGPISTSIGKAKSVVSNSMSKLANVARTSFTPPRAELAFDTSLNTSDFADIRGQMDTEVEDFELPEQERVIVIEMNSREVGRGVEKHVTDEQQRKKNRRGEFRWNS